MVNEQQHIIQKINIDVDVRGLSAARHIHDNIQELLHTVVFPQMEAVFNKMDIQQQVYRSEKLSLEFNFNSKDQLNEELAPALIKQLIETLKPVITITEAVKKRKAKSSLSNSDTAHFDGEETADDGAAAKETAAFENKSLQEKRWEVFIYFLQTGMLPWFAAGDSAWLKEDEILALINEDAVLWKASFFELIRKDAVAAKRLVYQFSIDLVVKFISKYTASEIAVPLKALLEATYIVSTTEQRKSAQLFLFNILQHLSGLPEESAIEQKQLQQMVSDAIADLKIKKKATEPVLKKSGTQKTKLVEEDSFYVANAGLILLHPFLQYYFKDFDLLQGEQFKDEQSRQTAIHLLYYLATGNEQPMECELIMEKYLCAADIHEPIERFEQLTDVMKEESDNLLNAVIHHWKALKSTSPDGLREAFLQRSGKLIIGDRERVIVEHAVIDILLEHLPWNYSIITLPWIDKILNAEWNEIS